MSDVNELYKFDGNRFSIELDRKDHPEYSESDPWPKSILTVRFLNVSPRLTQAINIADFELTLQGCSQERLEIRRQLWKKIVIHLIKTFGFTASDLFGEEQ